MADNDNDPRRDTHVTRETHVEKSSGNSGMAFILGGVVVAVLVIAYVLFGMGGGGDSAGDGAGDTNVTVEAPEGDDGAATDDGATADDGAATTEPAN